MICTDFVNYAALEKRFRKQAIACFCLGVYTGQVLDESFKQITVDDTKGFTDQMRGTSKD